MAGKRAAVGGAAAAGGSKISRSPVLSAVALAKAEVRFGFFRIMPTIPEMQRDSQGQTTRGAAPSTSTGSVQAPRVLAFPRQPQTFLIP